MMMMNKRIEIFLKHCLASSLCLWLYGIIMESFDAITHHTYFYDHTQCDTEPRTDDGERIFDQ